MAVCRPAGAPFNHESADVILRATDDVDFRVHKGILAIASPFFSDMFALGQGASDRPLTTKVQPEEQEGNLQVVPMLEENSEVLDKLLRLCYPVPAPDIKALDELTPVLAAALKYQLEHAAERLKSDLVSPRFMRDEPLRVFAIARRYNLDKETTAAIPHVLRQGLPGPYVDELKYIPASAIHRLWEVRRRATSLAASLASDFQWLTNNKAINRTWVFFLCTVCVVSDVTIAIDGREIRPRAWWKEYMRRAEQALRETPAGSVVTSSTVLWPSFKAMGTCATCGSGRGVDDLREFSEIFAARIDRTIMEIADGTKWD